MKERMLTGIKPTGNSITLGNYIGGLLPLIKYQDQFDFRKDRGYSQGS